jgi:hypothetical protein
MMLAGAVAGFAVVLFGGKRRKRKPSSSPITYSKQGKLLVIMSGGNA